jgi:hypothetical protein
MEGLTMIVYEYTCTTDPNVRLLVPKKEVPDAAKSKCKGEWKFYGQLEDDLKSDDTRLAVNSKQALEKIEQQGFHIARYEITSETRINPDPKKK